MVLLEKHVKWSKIVFKGQDMWLEAALDEA
jgi:hypothetical protein